MDQRGKTQPTSALCTRESASGVGEISRSNARHHFNGGGEACPGWTREKQ